MHGLNKTIARWVVILYVLVVCAIGINDRDFQELRTEKNK
jgi:lipopolysaccharide export system protein LptC